MREMIKKPVNITLKRNKQEAKKERYRKKRKMSQNIEKNIEGSTKLPHCLSLSANLSTIIF